MFFIFLCQPQSVGWEENRLSVEEDLHIHTDYIDNFPNYLKLIADVYFSAHYFIFPVAPYNSQKVIFLLSEQTNNRTKAHFCMIKIIISIYRDS